MTTIQRFTPNPTLAFGMRLSREDKPDNTSTFTVSIGEGEKEKRHWFSLFRTWMRYKFWIWAREKTRSGIDESELGTVKVTVSKKKAKKTETEIRRAIRRTHTVNTL